MSDSGTSKGTDCPTVVCESRSRSTPAQAGLLHQHASTEFPLLEDGDAKNKEGDNEEQRIPE